jgi:hypothetical protein
MLSPGPDEPDAEQVQQYIKLLVDELIILFEKGIVVKTPAHPDGTYLLYHPRRMILSYVYQVSSFMLFSLLSFAIIPQW